VWGLNFYPTNQLSQFHEAQFKDEGLVLTLFFSVTFWASFRKLL
jgi:hypothetical protein